MIKIGIDIVKDERVNKLENNSIYHPNELKLNLPSVFAIKEATMKALNKPHIWLDIEVKYSNNQPTIIISESIGLAIEKCDVSVSHEEGFTIAAVIIEIIQDNSKQQL